MKTVIERILESVNDNKEFKESGEENRKFIIEEIKKSYVKHGLFKVDESLLLFKGHFEKDKGMSCGEIFISLNFYIDTLFSFLAYISEKSDFMNDEETNEIFNGVDKISKARLKIKERFMKG